MTRGGRSHHRPEALGNAPRAAGRCDDQGPAAHLYASYSFPSTEAATFSLRISSVPS
jgi:hypothetical protein